MAAASELFRAKGFDGASMRDIAAAAGTTQAMLYRHFPSKADVFKETVVAPFHEFVDEFLAAMRTHSVSDLPNRELFARFNEHVYDLALQNRKLLLALFAAHEFSSEAIGDLTGTTGPGLLDFVAEMKDEQEARGWESVDIEVAARASVALLLGIALFDEWLFGRAKRRPGRKRILEELTELQLTGYTRDR